jgi:toxin ParE1/3/4
MARHNLDERAEADLGNIWDFINNQSGPTRADSVTDRIVDVFPLLAEQPYMGIARPEFGHDDLRSFVVRNTPYIIFYYPRDYGVEIAHIRHGSQELTNLFDE